MTRSVVDGSPLLPQVRFALRIKSHAFDQEILQLIAACLADLSIGGVQRIDTDDPLLRRASVLFCKGHFDNSPYFEQAYEDLKKSMTLAREYVQPQK